MKSCAGRAAPAEHFADSIATPPADAAAWVTDVTRWLFGAIQAQEAVWHDTQPGVMQRVGPWTARDDSRS